MPPDWHPCAGSVEIGWRLTPSSWGHGYATEAGRRVLELAFGTFELPEIVSYTARTNAPSIAVMRKLGLCDDGVGFDHPRIAQGDPLRAHVRYRVDRAELA